MASSNWESIIACYWQSDTVSYGVGDDFLSNISKTTQIGKDGDWADAVTDMNGELKDWKWKYESGNGYPTIVRVSI